jgi:hypothetical protein
LGLLRIHYKKLTSLIINSVVNALAVSGNKSLQTISGIGIVEHLSIGWCPNVTGFKIHEVNVPI